MEKIIILFPVQNRNLQRIHRNALYAPAVDKYNHVFLVVRQENLPVTIAKLTQPFQFPCIEIIYIQVIIQHGFQKQPAIFPAVYGFRHRSDLQHCNHFSAFQIDQLTPPDIPDSRKCIKKEKKRRFMFFHIRSKPIHVPLPYSKNALAINKSSCVVILIFR